ncbi:MAG: FAD-dependent oxidoreductase [Chitinivibrionales bacterium]|nr:FAD-dependent oxidoreductase [Chitinivibrionales bacterium]
MANPIKIKSTVKEILYHGEGVYTLKILPERKVPRYRPGQFLHLTIDDYDPQGGFWPESRVFSIASGPNSEEITIVYSVQGQYTTRMSKELSLGKEVWLKLPYGNFCIDTVSDSSKDILLIAGGTGISPYVPYLEQERQNPSGRRIILIYGARKEEHLLFKNVFTDCLQNLPQFSSDIFLETIPTNTANPYFPGRISFSHIWQKFNELTNPVCFLSGPPAMIRFFKTEFASKSIPDTQIKIDEWE